MEVVKEDMKSADVGEEDSDDEMEADDWPWPSLKVTTVEIKPTSGKAILLQV